MLRKLLATSDSFLPFIARVFLGAVIFAHGAQKLFGWFGGHGWSGTMRFFTDWGFPSFLVAVLILTESIGMLLLIAGAAGRIWAVAVIVTMIVAVIKARHFMWFFMNWYGERRGEGFEYHLLTVALGLIVLIGGSGRWSVDRLLTRSATPRST